MWSKRQLCEAALEELGLAAYVFDITPEEQQSAIRRLDSMMAQWAIPGIRLGYNLTADPLASDPDQPSGIPDSAHEAVFLNLALRIAPQFGKTPSRETKIAAKQGYDSLLAQAMSNPPEVQRTVLPAGAGSRDRTRRLRPFLTGPVNLLTAGPDSLLDFNGPSTA